MLINGWENWEPKDKSKKNVLETYRKKDKEEDKKMISKKNRPQEKHWWEEEDEGYEMNRNLKAEYDWEDKTTGKIKARLGVKEEMDDDGVGKIEGDQNNNGEDYGGQTGDNVEKVDGKVVGGIINKTKEEEEDDDEGHKNIVRIEKK